MRFLPLAFAMTAALLSSNVVAATSDNLLLRKVIKAYRVTPLSAVERSIGPKEDLGRALFFDPIVSGPRSIACAACHVRSLGSGDGLPVAVGLGASGVGEERLKSPNAFVIPRNALPLFNRGSKDLAALFWDGRVQFGPGGRVESPLGARLPAGFDSMLAVGAIFPPVEPDEMLGRALGEAGPSVYHADMLTGSTNADNFQSRTLEAFDNLMRRLVSPKDSPPSPMVQRYRMLFAAAYPGVPVEKLGIQHFGNAVAAYISAAFALQPARWDRYVAGDAAALTDQEKKGALVFFGKGRCAVCHSGTEFSDSRFHGLAVPQLRVGKSRHIDYGRGAANGRGEDRFAFRTPPLRNVAETPPYAHNGIFKTLPEVIEHHFNPVPTLYIAQQRFPEEAAHAGRLLGFRSPILAEISPLTKADVDLLVSFLRTISSSPALPDSVAIPSSVPSGNNEFVRR